MKHKAITAGAIGCVSPTTNRPTGVIEMKRHTRMLPVFGMTMAALTLGAAAPAVRAGENGGGGNASASSDGKTCDRPRGPTVVSGKAKLFFAHNSTNADSGVHGAFDPFSFVVLCVYNPKGRQILAVKPRPTGPAILLLPTKQGV